MKINKRKIILSIVLLIILGGLFAINSAFKGNPIGKFMMKKTAKEYLESNYSDRDFIVKDVYYDFKFGDYGANIESKSENIYFYIQKRGNHGIYDQYKEEWPLEDFRLQSLCEEELTKEFNSKIPENIKSNISNLRFFYKIDQNKYGKNQKFSKDLDDPVYAIVDFTKVADDEGFIESADKCREVILSMGIKNLEIIEFAGTNDTKDFERLSIVLKKEEFNINREGLKELLGIDRGDLLKEFILRGKENNNKELEMVDYQKELELILSNLGEDGEILSKGTSVNILVNVEDTLSKEAAVDRIFKIKEEIVKVTPEIESIYIQFNAKNTSEPKYAGEYSKESGTLTCNKEYIQKNLMSKGEFKGVVPKKKY